MKEVNLKTHASRQPLSALSKVMIAALVINLCAELFGLFAQLIFEGFVSIPLVIISVVLLIALGLIIATGKRWALVLGVLVVLVTSVLTLTRPGNAYSLLHPADPSSHFVPMAVILLTAVIAIVAGIVAMMRNNSDAQQLASH